jgi:hypothetical protein
MAVSGKNIGGELLLVEYWAFSTAAVRAQVREWQPIFSLFFAVFNSSSPRTQSLHLLSLYDPSSIRPHTWDHHIITNHISTSHQH